MDRFIFLIAMLAIVSMSFGQSLQDAYECASEQVSQGGMTELWSNHNANTTRNPSRTNEFYVGDPESPSAQVYSFVNYFFNDSLTQTIYTAADGLEAGTIYQMKVFMKNADGSIPAGKVVKLYMANTTQISFNMPNVWVPYDEFTQVFEGDLAVTEEGDYDVLITLDTPFAYGGGNLVVMVLKSVNESFGSSPANNQIMVTNTTYDGNMVFFRNSPEPLTIPPYPTFGGMWQSMPVLVNAVFYIDTESTGFLTGIVTSADTPVSDVIVSLIASTFTITTTTDVDGIYEFTDIVPAQYQITASKLGYYDYTSDDFEVLPNDNLTHNIDLVSLPIVSIYGRVMFSDTETAAMGVQLTLRGDETYGPVQSDASGDFIFSEVLSLRSYRLTVEYPAYQTFVLDIDVGEDDIDLGNLFIQEIIYRPSGVEATIVDDEVVITWCEPGIDVETVFTHSIGDEPTNGLGTGSNPLNIRAIQRFTAAQLNAFGVAGNELQSIGFIPFLTSVPGVEGAIVVYTGGSFGAGGINPGNLVHSQSFSLSECLYREWNDIYLDSYVEIPTNSELWIGVHFTNVNVHSDNFIPAIDAGPQYANYGDILCWNDMWQTIGSVYNVNWLIRGTALGAPQGVVHLARDTRAFESYSVYRFLVENLHNESEWTLIASDVEDLTAIDDSWSTIPTGEYRYAVKANYTHGIQSSPAFSNTLSKDLYSSVYVYVTAEDGGSVIDASIRFENQDYPDFTYITTIETGEVAEFPEIRRGIYTMTIRLGGYQTYSETDIVIILDPTIIEVNLQLSDYIFDEGFEGAVVPDLPLGWTEIDGEGLGWQTVNDLIQLQGVVNALAPFEGEVMMARTWAYSSPNNWAFTPPLELSAGDTYTINFLYIAPGYPQYQETDDFEVLIGTTPTPDDMVTEGTLLFAQIGTFGVWDQWLECTATFTAPTTDTYHIAFHDLTPIVEGFYIIIDNLTVSRGVSEDQDDTLIPVATSLKANYPNPFNPITTISFDNAREGKVSIDIFNIKGQKVKTLIDEIMTAGRHSVVWNGIDDTGRAVASGIYFYKMKTDDYNHTRKMVLLK